MRTPASLRTALASATALALSTPTSLHAQGTCADLNILSVTYAAFNDTSIEVVAQTEPATFFSYPSFSLVNEEGDTLTREEVNFFGIGEGQQTHSSPLVAGQSLPPSPFTGDVIFTYYGMDGMETCVYPFSGSLCPVTPCEILQVFVYNAGALVDAAFAWTITDEEGQFVDNGDLAIDAADQPTALAGLCLPPGTYTLHMERTSGPAGTYQYGLARDLWWTAGPVTDFLEGQENQFPFPFFEPCMEGTNAIDELHTAELRLVVADRHLTIAHSDGSALGSIMVSDARGRISHDLHTNAANTSLDLGSLPAGIYLVRVGDAGTASFVQRIILN